MSYSRLTSATKSHAAHLQPPKTDAIPLMMFMMPSVVAQWLMPQAVT